MFHKHISVILFTLVQIFSVLLNIWAFFFQNHYIKNNMTGIHLTRKSDVI